MCNGMSGWLGTLSVRHWRERWIVKDRIVRRGRCAQHWAWMARIRRRPPGRVPPPLRRHRLRASCHNHWACNWEIHSCRHTFRGSLVRLRPLRPRRYSNCVAFQNWLNQASHLVGISPFSWESLSFVAAYICSRDVPSCEQLAASWPHQWRGVSPFLRAVSIRRRAALKFQNCAFWDSLGPSCAADRATKPWKHSLVSWRDLRPFALLSEPRCRRLRQSRRHGGDVMSRDDVTLNCGDGMSMSCVSWNYLRN